MAVFLYYITDLHSVFFVLYIYFSFSEDGWATCDIYSAFNLNINTLLKRYSAGLLIAWDVLFVLHHAVVAQI